MPVSVQDLCQLVNADAPYWLVGMTEMTRTFGLELLESVLNDFPGVFLQVHAALLFSIRGSGVYPPLSHNSNMASVYIVTS